MSRRNNSRPWRRRSLSASWPVARPRLHRLEDRTVPTAAYYPPSYFLTGPSPAAANSSLTTRPPLDAALSFLGGHASDLGLTAADLADPIVTSQYTDADTGISHVYLRQQVNGLPVVNADFSVGIASTGAVISAGGGFVPGRAATLGPAGVQWPKIAAVDSVRWAAADLGLDLSAQPTEIDPFVGPIAKPLTSANLAAVGVSLDPIPAHLVYAPTPDGGAAEAWELVIRTPDGQHWYDVTVDAATGEMLAQADWVDDDAYNVIAPPNESPQDGGFNVVTNPANSTASPFGWQDTNGAAGPEFTDTRGNNVDAHLDRDADNAPDPTPGRPSGGSALDFSGYTYNPTLAPSALQNEYAAQANLFYVINTLHDVHYQYGFTEAAGNFQVNNYGRGGIGNDAVQADAQDGAGTNNANFATPVDGQSGRMQMYEWTSTTPRRDGDFDNDVIIHEFGHGVSNRLTGGPANSDALDATQSGGMGEGWSDFYSLMFQQRPTDTQNAGYGVATYVIGQPQTGGGLRRYRYSYDMSIDPLTWDAYGTGGTTSYGTARSTEVHNTGEIWASTLWDMNWLLINKYGFDADLATGWSPSPGPAHAGNKLALRLVMDAMKLQPANPSFTQARDAIIAADVALNGGNDLWEIWSAFARRGLGEGSSTPSSSSTATPTLSFTLPMLVESAFPATGAVVTAHPNGFYVLDAAAPISPPSLQASDFVVNGQPATGFASTSVPATAGFTFASDPVTAEGPQTIRVAAGAFNRASDGSAVAAYLSTFYVDATPLTITSVTPAAGATVAPPLTTVDVTLSEPIDPASVQASDLSISRGSVTGFSLLNGNTTVRFTVANLTNELPLTIGVAAGAFLDPQGNPNAAFDDGTVTLDYGTLPFPSPLQPHAPLGSLAYDGSVSATVGFAGDSDSFTLDLAAGQTLNVAVAPDATLQPRIAVTGPGTNLSATAAVAGATAQLNLISITTAGTYTLTVSGVGSTNGRYTLQPTLNVVPEAESNGGARNDALATAQPLGTSFLSPGGGLATVTVRGRSDPAGVVTEAEPNGTTATANPAGTYASAAGGNLYQIALAGSLGSSSDLDYFNVGPMQAGDILTVTLSGSGSGRGAATDPLVRLYRSGAPANVIQDDDSGPGLDALVYRFTVPTTDTYYIRTSSANASATVGTYQVAALLENAGAAPATGGTVTSEAEPNDSKTAATDVSGAWRSVTYTAVASGAITAGDTDLYAYQFTAGDVVTLVARSASVLVPQAALLDTAGNVLASDDGTSSAGGAGGLSPVYGYVIPTTGTYYFRVTGGSGSTGGYTAEVTLSTPVTLPTAPPGQDLYSFTLAAGQPASAVVNAAMAGALDVAILDPTGTAVAGGVAGPTNVDKIVSNFVAPAAGTYYLRVSGPPNVDYQATVVTGGTFDAEPNDTSATAQSLLAGESVLGAISGNDDWYQVTLAPGAVITLATATPGDTARQFTNVLDPAIELYDPSNTLIGSDDNSAGDGRNATLTRTAAAAGSYRIRITGVGGTAGEYVLKAGVVPPPATVQEVQVADGSGQRSVVRSLAVTFSGPVTFSNGPAAAFQLARTGPTGPTGNVALTPTVTADAQGRTVVTLTFSGALTEANTAAGANPSLIDGLYTLTVSGSAVTGPDGLALDGDGDGTPGGDKLFSFHRLFGDYNGDRTVDPADLFPYLQTALFTSVGQPGYLAAFDFDGNGVIDPADLFPYLQDRLFTSI